MIAKININTSTKTQKEKNERAPSLIYKTCVFVLKALFLIPVIEFIFSMKIIPAGSLGSFSGSASCVYSKQFFSNSASTIASLLRGRKVIFPGLTKELMQSIRHPIAQNQLSTYSTIACQNTIGLLKRFKIIADRYRNRRKRFGLRFNLISGVYNLELFNGF